MKTLALCVLSTLFLSTTGLCTSIGSRGGSDYGGGAFPPNSTCGSTGIPGGSANCVYYAGMFGATVNDTIFQFVPASNSSIYSAAVTLTDGVQWSDISLYGEVKCPLLNTDAPCTASTSVGFALAMTSKTTGLLSFTGLSDTNTGNSNALDAGLTIFFDDPNATAPFATVGPASPEPDSAGIIAAGVLFLGALAAWKKRRLA
jgi:hypothetical protein